MTLLCPDDPPAFSVTQPGGRSPFLLIADHAGQAVPRALRLLGLPQHELDRHIGWDIGIAGVARELGARLDAFTLVQSYSRLVIDCNRPLTSPTSIATESDGTVIPGNQGLDDEARAARARAIFTPYHDRIRAELDARAVTVMISLHSFTPVFRGVTRPWHTGVLYNRDGRLSQALRARMLEEGWVVGDNEPYAVSDASDYAIPVHAEPRGLHHVELEIRQDLISDAAGQREWAERLHHHLSALLPRFT